MEDDCLIWRGLKKHSKYKFKNMRNYFCTVMGLIGLVLIKLTSSLAQSSDNRSFYQEVITYTNLGFSTW